jgi:hypothetical protein
MSDFDKTAILLRLEEQERALRELMRQDQEGRWSPRRISRLRRRRTLMGQQMISIERLARDKHLSSSARLVGAEILRKIDPVTGRARITAEQLADTLHIAVGTVRKATNVLTDRSYFQKVKVGRNIEFVVASRPETGNGTLNS